MLDGRWRCRVLSNGEVRSVGSRAGIGAVFGDAEVDDIHHAGHLVLYVLRERRG